MKKAKAKPKKIDKKQAGFLKLIKEKVNLPVESQENLFSKILLKLKGQDNYVTSLTYFTGIVAGIFILTALILALLPASQKKQLYNNISNLVETKKVKPTVIPTPTPRPIAKGPQTYGVSTKANPQMREIWVNEFDPKRGEKQIFRAKIRDISGASITTVELKLITDHKSKIYPFSLTSGTNTEGEWTVSLITDDSHDYIYSAFITMKNSKGNSSKVELSFR